MRDVAFRPQGQQRHFTSSSMSEGRIVGPSIRNIRRRSVLNIRSTSVPTVPKVSLPQVRRPRIRRLLSVQYGDRQLDLGAPSERVPNNPAGVEEARQQLFRLLRSLQLDQDVTATTKWSLIRGSIYWESLHSERPSSEERSLVLDILHAYLRENFLTMPTQSRNFFQSCQRRGLLSDTEEALCLALMSRPVYETLHRINEMTVEQRLWALFDASLPLHYVVELWGLLLARRSSTPEEPSSGTTVSSDTVLRGDQAMVKLLQVEDVSRRKNYEAVPNQALRNPSDSHSFEERLLIHCGLDVLTMNDVAARRIVAASLMTLVALAKWLSQLRADSHLDLTSGDDTALEVSNARRSLNFYNVSRSEYAFLRMMLLASNGVKINTITLIAGLASLGLSPANSQTILKSLRGLQMRSEELQPLFHDVSRIQDHRKATHGFPTTRAAHGLRNAIRQAADVDQLDKIKDVAGKIHATYPDFSFHAIIHALSQRFWDLAQPQRVLEIQKDHPVISALPLLLRMLAQYAGRGEVEALEGAWRIASNYNERIPGSLWKQRLVLLMHHNQISTAEAAFVEAIKQPDTTGDAASHGFVYALSSVGIWNTMLRLLLKANESNRAEKYLQQLETDRISRPTAATYFLFIRHFLSREDLAKASYYAQRLFEEQYLLPNDVDACKYLICSLKQLHIAIAYPEPRELYNAIRAAIEFRYGEQHGRQDVSDSVQSIQAFSKRSSTIPVKTIPDSSRGAIYETRLQHDPLPVSKGGTCLKMLRAILNQGVNDEPTVPISTDRNDGPLAESRSQAMQQAHPAIMSNLGADRHSGKVVTLQICQPMLSPSFRSSLADTSSTREEQDEPEKQKEGDGERLRHIRSALMLENFRPPSGRGQDVLMEPDFNPTLLNAIFALPRIEQLALLNGDYYQPGAGMGQNFPFVWNHFGKMFLVNHLRPFRVPDKKLHAIYRMQLHSFRSLNHTNFRAVGIDSPKGRDFLIRKIEDLRLELWRHKARRLRMMISASRVELFRSEVELNPDRGESVSGLSRALRSFWSTRIAELKAPANDTRPFILNPQPKQFTEPKPEPRIFRIVKTQVKPFEQSAKPGTVRLVHMDAEPIAGRKQRARLGHSTQTSPSARGTANRTPFPENDVKSSSTAASSGSDLANPMPRSSCEHLIQSDVSDTAHDTVQSEIPAKTQSKADLSAANRAYRTVYRGRKRNKPRAEKRRRRDLAGLLDVMDLCTSR
jgi:hypothetical protein